MTERTFTLDEAQALLPELRERLARIQAAREAVIAGTQRVDHRVRQDPGGVADPELFAASRALRVEVQAVADAGAILRDAASGLFDFPTEREGTPAFLCWRADEDRIAFWHPEDSGASGRRPL